MTSSDHLASARTYAEQAADSPVSKCLATSRGLNDRALITRLGLGYVRTPAAGHEHFRGRMSIPYLRYGPDGATVAAFRFACIAKNCEHEGHDAIASWPGPAPRLYNMCALLAPTEVLFLCEGEWDTMTALTYGLQAVGIPDIGAWRPYLAPAFNGYQQVRLIARRDDHGQRLAWAAQTAGQIPNAVVSPCPPGLSLNGAHRAGLANDVLRGPPDPLDLQQ